MKRVCVLYLVSNKWLSAGIDSYPKYGFKKVLGSADYTPLLCYSCNMGPVDLKKQQGFFK